MFDFVVGMATVTGTVVNLVFLWLYLSREKPKIEEKPKEKPDART